MKSHAFVLVLLFSFGAFFVLLINACAPYPQGMTAEQWTEVMKVGAAQGCMYLRSEGNPPASNVKFVLIQKYGAETPKFDLQQCFDAIPPEMRSRMLGGQ